MKFRRYGKLHSSVDMTPIIDVVFILLTFFMLTSTYIKNSAFLVDLPESRTSDAQPLREAVITILRSGDIILNDTNTTLESLGTQIQAMHSENKDIVVTIQGDKGIAYGKLIEVMDTVRKTGIKRMSLATSLSESLDKEK